MKRYILLIIILAYPGLIFCQPNFHFYQSNMVRVVDSKGVDFKNPFGGGLKFPVFTSMDLNFDNKPDLIVLDRADDRILTFINDGGLDTVKYSYRPEYEDVFSSSLNKYITFLDYNNDGKPDLFTFASKVGSGIELYKNISFGNKILFEPYYPDPIDPQNSALISTFYGNSYKISIPVKSCDIPSFIDADKDGDIDFFTFDELGGSYLWYLKNFSQETNANADSMILDLVDSYWGYFMEGDLTNLVYLGRKSAFPWKHYIRGAGPVRHAGSTVLVNDMNGDGDLDLLVGDVGYPGIRYLINGKKDSTTWFDSIITQDTFFPTSKPVNIHNMPAAFNIDINNDGAKDFVFSPMDENLTDNRYVDGLKQVWYYKNSGTDNNPVLNFVKDNFIQEDMVDLGGATSPAFFDYDGDGDNDLFVATKGNNIETKYLADRIVLFENIGTSVKPIFQKMNDNYLTLTTKGYKSLSLHFGDVDADGKKDLIMGNANGHLIFYKNNSVTNLADFSFVTDYFDSIDVGDYSVPAMADIDKDSMSELIIGSKKGKIYYYKNIGTIGTAKFKLVTDSFGEINLTGDDYYCAPFIADMDANGHPDMILSYNFMDLAAGFLVSKVVIYKDIDLNPDQPLVATDTIFYNIISNSAVKKYIGRKLRPAATDLDGDSLPDLMFGSERGGLLFYGTNTSLSTQIKVSGKTLLCQGDSAILDAGPGFDSYKWNTGANTQQIVVYKPESYECVVQKGSFSYKAYMSIQMHSGSVQANFTYTNNDLTVDFMLLNENIDSVRWSFGDSSYSNDKNPSHTFAKTGYYTVCAEIYDNCGASDTICKPIYFVGINDAIESKITIFPNPVEKFMYIHCNSDVIGQKVQLKVTDALGREVINQEIIMKENQSINVTEFTPGVYPLTISDSKGKLILKTMLLKVGM